MVELEIKQIELNNGETLAYRSFGKGKKTLLLVHGNICSGLHFMPLLPFLSTDITTYIVDLRGFGDSSYHKKIKYIRDLSEDVYEFIHKIGKEKVTVLGWSAGGPVCMQLAADHGKSVERLILVSSVGYKGCPIYDEHGNSFKTMKEMSKEKMQIAPALRAIELQQEEVISRLWDDMIYVNEKPSAEDKKWYVMASLKQRNLLEMYWALAHFNLSDGYNGYVEGNHSIGNMTMPTLGIWGKDDRIVSEMEMRETLERIGKNAKFIKLEKCGHSPFLDQPDNIAKELMRFMGAACYVYMLACADGSIYTGWTNDLNARLKMHNSGKGSKCTRMHLPVTLVYGERFTTKSEALKREYAIKQLSRKQKMELISSERNQLDLFFS